MKLSYTLIGVGTLGLILSSIFFLYFSRYLNIIGLFLSLVSLIIGIIWEKENRDKALMSLEENRLQHLQIIEKIDNYEGQIKHKSKQVGKLASSNTKLKQLMNKVTMEMRKEHLSKESLLRKMDKPIYGILLFKGHEHDLNGSKNKPLRDEILPNLGFNHLKGNRGTYLLPPSRLPAFSNRKELEKWITKNILDRIPKNYRYVIPFIQLIDLRFTFSKKKDKLTKKDYDFLLDSIAAEELLNFSESLNYLQKKKKISLKDIVETPHIHFLLDNTSINQKDKELLNKKNKEIVGQLEDKLGREIFTRDFVNMSNEDLTNILNKYIQIEEKDVKIIKQNAQFWVNLFNKNFLNDNLSI